MMAAAKNPQITVKLTMKIVKACWEAIRMEVWRCET